MRVRYLRSALADLESISDYIALDNPEAADRVIAKITGSINVLKRHPATGRAGRVTGTRELVIVSLPYIIPYRVRENWVEVLRILHTSRKWPVKF